MLTKEELKARVPSALATNHDGIRSDEYTFISTEGIIDLLTPFGFELTAAKQSKIRKDKERRLGHCKHNLIFRNDKMGFPDPRGYNGSLSPTISVINSSDGTCSYQFRTGLFAILCTNGLIVYVQDFGSFRQNHLNTSFEAIKEWALEYIERIPEYSAMVGQMSHIELSVDQQIQFAQQAIKIRWEENAPNIPTAINSPRRSSDQKNDLWTVFNRVQENIMMGGYKGNKNRRVREIKGIDTSVNINSQLWDLAKGFMTNG